MKNLLMAAVAAMVLVGCGGSETEGSPGQPPPTQQEQWVWDTGVFMYIGNVGTTNTITLHAYNSSYGGQMKVWPVINANVACVDNGTGYCVIPGDWALLMSQENPPARSLTFLVSIECVSEGVTELGGYGPAPKLTIMCVTPPQR